MMMTTERKGSEVAGFQYLCSYVKEEGTDYICV